LHTLREQLAEMTGRERGDITGREGGDIEANDKKRK
jgi:hypothetical protein